MKYAAAVIDTNVVTAGVLTRDADSPTAKILDGMLRGALPFLLSTALLAEYRQVLLRKKIKPLHGLSERDVDALLTTLAANAIVREPKFRGGSFDPEDAHVWSLVQSEPGCVLITGDRALLEYQPLPSAVLSPRLFVDQRSR